MLIASLRAFTGEIPAAYASQKEFFITSLQNMAEHLYNLQKETLKETCESFDVQLGKGKITEKEIAKLKDALDKLISDKDFRMVCAGMTGSKELIKKRLSALRPVSLTGEARKAGAGAADAERRIMETYARLRFQPLAEQMNAAPNDRVIDEAPMKARAEVAEYCCLYHVPLNEDDTLTPFSLSCVDAAIAACYRLLSNLHKALGTGIAER